MFPNFELLLINRRPDGSLVGTVPPGYNAVAQVGGINYTLNNYHDYPGHTPGARITGDGVTVELDPDHHMNAINRIILDMFPGNLMSLFKKEMIYYENNAKTPNPFRFSRLFAR